MPDGTHLRANRIASILVDQVSRVLAGKREVVELAVVALLARGHLLIEDVPGVGKTTLARALAKSIGVSFRRLQFTSDLMPADVVGGNVLDPKTGAFSFRPGPVFTHVLLADEINRTTPRTQSALLEAMDERQVSVDGVTHALHDLFFVVATQNPEEFYGTYPLPESQLDRFLMRVRIGYPSVEVERSVIANRRGGDPMRDLASVVSEEDLIAAQADVNEVRVDDAVLDYLHALVLQTRESTLLELGASTRAALALERTVRAYALVKGRAFALPDDVKAVASSVLAHRVRVAGASNRAPSGRDAERIIRELLQELVVPL
ncbi:MAG: MoxR family ATPase [Sandaracinaceae bacterium]|jgi:MoxR-like ATPase|nr:MoxR family ATPase [Sandaracinaceae bacterium]